jgi:hypothetical protein
MSKKLLLSAAIAGVFALNADAQSWGPVGPGNYTSAGRALAFDGNDIYASGTFINGADVFSFGKLSNGTWSALGDWKGIAGGIGVVMCATKIGDDIYVGGNFSNGAANPDIDNIGRWNITTQTWHPLGTGLNSYVTEIVQMGTDIIAAGKFTDAGGDANADYVAKWNGTSWSAISPTVLSASSFTVVSALAVNGNNLFIGGNFENGGGVSTADYLVKWNGTSYEDVGGWGGTVGGVFEIYMEANGDMIIGGEFPLKVAKYNASSNSWAPLGTFSASGATSVNSITKNGNDVYIAGNLTNAAGTSTDNIAKYNGSTWEGVAGGLNAVVYNLQIHNNKLYAAGNFTDASGNASADRLAVLDLTPSTSIESEKLNTSVEIFPNPIQSGKLLNVSVANVKNTNNNLQISIFDISGKLILSQNEKINTNNSSKTTLNIHHLQPGLYFITIQSGEQRFTSKIVVN